MKRNSSILITVLSSKKKIVPVLNIKGIYNQFIIKPEKTCKKNILKFKMYTFGVFWYFNVANDGSTHVSFDKKHIFTQITQNMNSKCIVGFIKIY